MRFLGFSQKFLVQIIILIFTVSFLSQTFAASGPVPSSAEPGQISRTLSNLNAGPSPQAPPASGVGQRERGGGLPPQILALKFRVNQIIITGNTVYSTRALIKLFRKRLGTEVTLGDIQDLADDITQKYRNDGYVLSQAVIPAQTIQGGVIRIQVIEGYISSVKVDGPISDKNKALIAQYGNKIVNKKPLQVRDLERYTLLVNDIAGMDVRAIIAPSKTTLGGADLTLAAAEQKHFSGYFIYDNRGTRYIGPQRYTGAGYFNTLIGGGTHTGIKASTVPKTQELSYYEFDHTQILNTEGLQLNVDGQFTRSVPRFVLEGTDTVGRSKIGYGTLQYPFIRERAQSLYGRGVFGYINSNVNSFGTKLYNDQIRQLQLGTTYDFFDRYQSSNEINFSLTQGLPILGATPPDAVLISRAGAVPYFTRLNLDASRLQPLNESLSLAMSFSGQYSNKPLYSYEQIGYGGLPFGNAYDPFEIVGDRGIMGKLELRYDTAPLPHTTIQYFGYYDGAMLWNINNINVPGRSVGTSAGFGTRIGLTRFLNINLELDKPLNRNQQVLLLLPDTNPRSWRGFFSFVLQA